MSYFSWSSYPVEPMTLHHAKYYSHFLTLQQSNIGTERLWTTLLNATIDLNPHQVQWALFFFKNPLHKGVILADEVGLGKTIEAWLVLCQLWSEYKRKILLIVPASLRKQWKSELEEKIERILERIKNHKEVSSKYNIFYLRNLVGKKWVALRYENIDGEFANFYSDFLFWFINKEDGSDVTVIYLEPKWDGIDKNWEKKKEKLAQITSVDVPSEIHSLFGDKTTWSNKYTGVKVLGVMQMEF